jgi:hypothetical protein
MKKAILLASVGVLLLSNPAKTLADDVLYCTENATAGLDPDNGYTAPVSFERLRFTLSPSNSWSSVDISYTLNGYENYKIYSCQQPFTSTSPEIKSCTNDKGLYTLNINVNNGRFIWSWGFGDLDGPNSNKGDSVRTSVGVCTQF